MQNELEVIVAEKDLTRRFKLLDMVIANAETMNRVNDGELRY